MIVVSDTSPLNYLVLIKAIAVLPALFAQVVVPERVARELASPDAPAAVRTWIGAPPAWLVIRSPASADLDLRLDPGERDAIALAQELGADHLLMDEWAGRAVAKDLGLHVVGTLGVLDQAAERNLLSLQTVFDRLLQTNFRIDRQLVERLLLRNAQRRRRKGLS